jgi:hypothetical protein
MLPTPAVLQRVRAPRRRPAALLGAVGVVLALTLAGCSRTPTTYTSSVKNDFVKGCEQNGLSTSVCTCTYGKIEQNIPFKEFSTVQSKLRESPKPLDQINETGKKMLDFRTQCEQQSS